MKLSIHTTLDYALPAPTDLILQVEAAILPEQDVAGAHIAVYNPDHFARVPGDEMIGERIMLRVAQRLSVEYSATVTVLRQLADLPNLAAAPPHLLPGPAVNYLHESRFCQSSRFERFVAGEFPGLYGGALVAAMRDYISSQFRYVSGASGPTTTAVDTFVCREGVCRDFAHVLIAMARAASIPARFASVYAPDVDPPDFHAVCEVFLGGSWHLVDPTGMAKEGEMAKIAVGRDAADVAFLTSFGPVMLNAQEVSVRRVID